MVMVLCSVKHRESVRMNSYMITYINIIKTCGYQVQFVIKITIQEEFAM
jgi:hypothetical protein